MFEESTTGVEPNGPAGLAGLADGDVIIGWNGREISRIDDLHRLLVAVQTGRASRLEFIRDNSVVEIEVTPGDSQQ